MKRICKKSVLIGWGLVAGLTTGGWAQQPSSFELNFAAQPAVATSETSTSNVPKVEVGDSVEKGLTLNDCRMVLEPLKTVGEQGYRMKVSIPNSVKEIELVPDRLEDGRDSFRVVIGNSKQNVESRDAPTSPVPRLAKGSNSGKRITNVDRKFLSNPFFPQSTEPTADVVRSVSSAAPIVDYEIIPESLDLGRSGKTPREESKLMRQVSMKYATTSSPAFTHNLEVQDSEIKDSLSNLHSETDELTSRSPGAPLLQATLNGPSSLHSGAYGEFELIVANASSVIQRNVVVRLQLPSGLKIADPGRVAWIDEKQHSVRWEIPELQPKNKEVIRYVVKSNRSGVQVQEVTVQTADRELDKNGDPKTALGLMPPAEFSQNVQGPHLEESALQEHEFPVEEIFLIDSLNPEIGRRRVKSESSSNATLASFEN